MFKGLALSSAIVDDSLVGEDVRKCCVHVSADRAGEKRRIFIGLFDFRLRLALLIFGTAPHGCVSDIHRSSSRRRIPGCSSGFPPKLGPAGFRRGACGNDVSGPWSLYSFALCLHRKCDPGCGIRDAGRKHRASFHSSWVPPRNDNLYEIPPTPLYEGGRGDFMLRCDPRGHEGLIVDSGDHQGSTKKEKTHDG
jgi:hypothetical protein